MSLERRILLRWLSRQHRALSSREIFAEWEPTWRLEELDAMLSAMLRHGQLVVEGHGVARYRLTQSGLTSSALEVEMQA